MAGIWIIQGHSFSKTDIGVRRLITESIVIMQILDETFPEVSKLYVSEIGLISSLVSLLLTVFAQLRSPLPVVAPRRH